ncbi:unnamed protein product, partial [Candidula unifasciata]
ESVTSLLEKHGAKRDSYLSEMVSHVIADSTTSDDYSEAKELFELPIVTSDWVVLSVKCGRQLPKEVFSLEGRLFSGVVACPSELESEDVLPLWGMIVYHGGRCQLDLDDAVTHLITACTEGLKYESVQQHTEKVHIVTPDWVTDTIAKNERQDEEIYHPHLVEYPKPKPPTPLPESVCQNDVQIQVSDNTPSVSEPMDVSISASHNIQSEAPRPDTPNAKEALARKISSRVNIMISEPATPEKTGMPSFHSLGSPGSAGIVRLPSPVPSLGMGLHLRHEVPNIRNTLRNITNRAAALPVSMPVRASVPCTSNVAHVPPVVVSNPPQAPPPDYPFPPKAVSHPVQQPATSQSSVSTPNRSQSSALYHGHDPKENVPPDLCLLGCIFCIVDYQSIIGSDELNAWQKVIEQYGGQVESSYSSRVTHVLCANQKSDVFKVAQKEGKRLVSAFWLNDCLMQKKMVPPWQALHLPLSFNSEKPGFNQMISVTNFDGEERVRLKQMINAIGAKYTGYMTHHNSALICKKPGGMKFEKAKEWRIAVVNVQWLSDLVLGNMDALRLPVHVRYLQVGQGREFHMDLTRVSHLMGGWKTSLKINKETWKKFAPSISSFGQENRRLSGPSPPKRLKVDTASSAPEAEVGAPRVMFTLYPKSLTSRLEAIVKKLGGVTVNNPCHCTHLVCPSLARTIKFFVAINCCHFILTKKWLEDSAAQDRFLEETPYALKDEKGEAALGCNIMESLRRAQIRHLFQDLVFHITPSVVPPVCEMTSIIQSAGGTVVQKRPSVKQIATSMDEKGHPKIIVITCLNDLHLSQDLRNKKIPVYNAEFVLTGVMRQDIDFNMFRIMTSV